MTKITPEMEERLRQIFKQFNRFMLWMWRLGLGPIINMWPEKMGQIMVLTHIGRKSGQRRQTPVNYALVNGDVYCTAGFGAISDWYRNVRVNPQVEIWLPDGWWEGTAEDVSDAPDRLALLRAVLIGSGFAAEAAGIFPQQMDDAALDAATQTYRLMRIYRTAARTGPGGPGELAWVWPLATFLLLPLLWRRRHCR